MAHCHELYRMGVKGGLEVRTFGNQVVVHTQVGRQFRCRKHRIVRYDFIAAAVFRDSDDGAVFHRESGEVTHTLVGSLAEEPAAFQVRQLRPERFHFADCRH